MLRLKCLGGPLYGQEYSHAHDEFIFKDKQTGKQTHYRKQTLDFTPPPRWALNYKPFRTLSQNYQMKKNIPYMALL
ncbi:hypothetical protein [Acinetobacter nosocomialis]|uniref:hypothetical protein n=1 Tax=Acinetobacter nosocomialis TaxID=106654 RepID=UPI0009B95C02|nr:hypothetical protein [Acinetobacter nosocomialis]